MSEYTTAIVSTGPDTLTCSVAWEGGPHSFIDLTQYLLREDVAQGSKQTYFKRGGYRGLQTKHVGLAFAPGRVLAELRGSVAHEFWPHYLDRAEKVSRLDLEVTARQDPYDKDLAMRHYFSEDELAREVGRPSTMRLEATASGGTTLYIGRGASRYQARLYEASYKHRGEGFEECWRYEVQARRERAAQMADHLRGATDVRSLVSAYVHSHFSRRRIPPIFAAESPLQVAPLSRPDTDVAKSLNWLATSVRPALKRHEAWGTHDRALAALGILDS